MCCQTNMNCADRALRLVIGVCAAYAYWANYLEAPWSYLLLALALIAIATATSGVCLVYGLLGISTKKAEPLPEKKKEAKKPAKKKGKK